MPSYTSSIRGINNMSEFLAIDVERLRELCREFDKKHGWYPEHEAEGWCVMQFILNRLTGTVFDEDAPDEWWDD